MSVLERIRKKCERYLGSDARKAKKQERVYNSKNCERAGGRRAAQLVSAALLIGSVPAAFAQNEPTISGRWATQGFGSIVEFSPCESDAETLCGRIIWLWAPNDQHGRPRADDENPDRALRGRPLVGVEIVQGLTETAPGVWSGGELYNPDDGRTYRGSIRVVDGALRLKGCAARIFCKTQTWRRLDDVAAAIERLNE